MDKARILVVEDEHLIAEDIQERLKNFGYEVPAIADGGEAAVAQAAVLQPDLVLMDIRLRGDMDGIETARVLRERFNVPVIYLTGEADGATLERAKATEPLGFLLKPIEEKRLYSTIEIALYKHRMDRRLRRIERWFGTALKSIGDAVMVTDTQGLVTFMNPMAEKLTGWRTAEAARRPLTEVYQTVNAETREKLESLVPQALLEGVVAGATNRAVLVSRKGTETPIDDSAAPIRDAAGNITGIVLTFRDVSERQRVEQALHESEERFRLLVEGVQDYAIFMLDPAGKVTSWNSGAERLLGYRSDEIIGAHLARFFTPLDVRRAKPEQNLEQASLQGRAEDEGWRVRKDGSRFQANVIIAALRDEQSRLLGFAQVTRDITGLKQAEKQLKDSREQLRALAAYLQSVREEERTRIAREVHDELGQALTGLKMDIAWLEKKFTDLRELPTLRPLRLKTRKMPGLVDEIISKVRKIATELRPGVLDDLGLEAAIEWQIQDFQKRTRIKCEFTSNLKDIQLSPDSATAVFRIFQETLTNIVRHANATRVRIRLEATRGKLLLEVHDNGRGMTARDISGAKSLGLLGMRERAMMLDGEVTIVGRRGKGTTVGLRIPLVHPEETRNPRPSCES
ncbi:MAG: PAS domain S-box protein [Verrucomicrobia bacterium]|nr:MAG: PAS domain S-box protein [Verrucomicrobiota bacterium]